MTLTAAGVAAGFSLSTFASDFPTVVNGTVGPLGIAFPKTGGVLVADYNGEVRGFGDVDGLDAQNAMVTYNAGAAAAPSGMVRADGNIYLALQGDNSIAELNDGGMLINQNVLSYTHPTGMVTNPTNGHFFIDGSNGIDFDPMTGMTTPVNLGFDGMAITVDGNVLFGANGTGVVGLKTADWSQVFGSGTIPGNTDGVAVGGGCLTGNIFVNTNGGTLVEVNLGTLAQTVIASGGSRGDFVTVDPNNGSLLVTQSDEVLRLTPPSCGPFPTPQPPVTASGGYVVQAVEGASSSAATAPPG